MTHPVQGRIYPLAENATRDRRVGSASIGADEGNLEEGTSGEGLDGGEGFGDGTGDES